MASYPRAPNAVRIARGLSFAIIAVSQMAQAYVRIV